MRNKITLSIRTVFFFFFLSVFSIVQAETIEVTRDSNIRSGPSTKNKVVTWAKKGITLDKVGEKGSWAKVKLKNGKEGWIAKSLIRSISSPAHSGYTHTPVIKIPQFYPGKKRPIAKNCWKAKAGKRVGKVTGGITGGSLVAVICNVAGVAGPWGIAGCAVAGGAVSIVGSISGSIAGEKVGGWLCN